MCFCFCSTGPKICAILQLHIDVVELIYDDLTQIKDGLPKVDGFVDDDSNFSHHAPYQFIMEGNSFFEVPLHHLLKICLLISDELDVPMPPDILHCLPEHHIVYEREEVLLEIILSHGSKLVVELSVWC